MAEMSRLGLASSYGVGAREVEIAFERGVNFFFWGALRRWSFGEGVRKLGHRAIVAIQTFVSAPWMIRTSVDLARARLKRDTIDILCLAYRKAIEPGVLDAAQSLVDRNVVRSLMVSSHDRALLASLAREPKLDWLMVRYSAGHRGAEDTVFSAINAHPKKILAYTATRWGSLLDPASLPKNERAPRGSDCYRFVLSHSAVTACLFGPANEAEMIEAIEAIDRPMSEEELAWMRRVGDHVRSQRRAPLGVRDIARHAREMARSIRTVGITEDLLSRFNR